MEIKADSDKILEQIVKQVTFMYRYTVEITWFGFQTTMIKWILQ